MLGSLSLGLSAYLRDGYCVHLLKQADRPPESWYKPVATTIFAPVYPARYYRIRSPFSP